MSSVLGKHKKDVKKKERRKTIQVKGAHDKSYFDISTLVGNKSLESLASYFSSNSVFDISRSVSQFMITHSSSSPDDDDDDTKETGDKGKSDDQGSSKNKKNSLVKLREHGKCLMYEQTPTVFQGKYTTVAFSETDLLFKRNRSRSGQPPVVDSGIANGKPATEMNWKYVVEPPPGEIKKRGFYSETISPLLRPERILAERQKERERLRKIRLEEEPKYGEEEGEYLDEGEYGESLPWETEKEWPPIYKVLNPEQVLNEFDQPVAYKEPSLILKGRMPTFAPNLKTVPVVTSTRNFLQPEENWVIYETEPNIAFPVKAFKPRCYLLHYVEPGTLPRKVLIERRRRAYLSQNLEEILARNGLTEDDLLPPTTTKIEDQFSLYGTSSFLPLEVFDNEGFDQGSVKDWLELGTIDGIQHPIPAVAFVPLLARQLNKLNIGKSSFRFTSKKSRQLLALTKQKKLQDPTSQDQLKYMWMDVAVTHYDYKMSKWAILTLDGTQTRFYLPRIYVMFRAEDPENFAKRLLDAVLRRRETEKIIKFNIYCDCMRIEGLPDLDDDTMERVRKSVTRYGFLKGVEDIITNAEAEVQIGHKKVLAKMSLLHSLEKYPQIFSFIEHPTERTIEPPAKCLVTTGMNDFEGTKRKLRVWWVYVIDETYLAMMHVVIACLKVTNMSFFTASFGKYVSLEEFDSIQTSYTNNLVKYLRNEWVGAVVTNVRMCLQDVGKGWFNIKEKCWFIFELSKLCRLMELIKFRMQTALKFLVENSTDMLVKIIETPSCVCRHVSDEDFVWGPDLINTQFKPSTAPIFTLALRITRTEPAFTTNPETFEEVLLKLYDNAIIQSHTIRQIHPYLLLNLRFPELYLSSIGLMDPLVLKKRERIKALINKALIPLKAYAKEYEKYVELYNLDVQSYISNFAATNPSANKIKEEIEGHIEHQLQLKEEIPSSIVIGPFLVTIEFVRSNLVERKQLVVDQLLHYFADRLRHEVSMLLDEVKALALKMKENPTSIEHLFEIKEWLETVPTTIKGYEDNIKRISSEYEILELFWYGLENDDFDNKIALLGWPNKLTLAIEDTLDMLAEETDKFYRIQQLDEAAVWEKFDWCANEVKNFMKISDPSKIHETAVLIRKVWKAMKDNQDMAILLATRQKLFGVEATSFEPLNRLAKDFTPYKELWLTASDWLKYQEMWMNHPLERIDGESIDRIHGELYKTMLKCQRIFAEVPPNYELATTIKNDIDAFRPYVPLIMALKCPGMKDRHWTQIIKQTGCHFRYTPTLTFKDCLAAGLYNQMETVIKISETATKEHSIEMALEEMEKEWEGVELELQPYKDTGTYILKLPDEVVQMLEDHIVQTQQFSFSPFKGMFEKKIDDWEAKLRLISSVLDEWVECQKQWMYLEPIFSSEDIVLQLPHESRKFITMERSWRRIMKGALEMPKMTWYCSDKRLLETLKECNFLLEQIQKGLAEYLESKRMIFPRLYFLSDDELLEILAQSKNPLAVQPHLRKCFENIYKLNFESDLKITKMYSAEGECVNLVEHMYPKGSVEYWLFLVEEAMKTTVRVTLGRALANLPQVERTRWVLSWPGQIVIAGSQTYWTASVEEAIRFGSLDQYFQLMLTQLDGLRGLVSGPLKKAERQILSALIVIEVHARDVTHDLHESQVKNENDFDWISQLRYYWVKDTDLKVRAVNAEFQYGYEYLGNSGRLVITPLTDRCYLTLTGALHLKFGGAPAGPAGTGKTETTKDLAKAFAIQCVVFNCSDQLDFMAMGKFFKGLASSGAWACFDEFNRIDIEVLSVIAQQVVTIQKAQIQRLERFMFEGTEIVLKPSCAVFITMNPGYAGRTELPDNLKALFRPVAMMVPNYALIAEISLFSFGFDEAKELAGKITTTFKLSSEQLSSQDHYDFGMRAVKTVIAVAGNLKREQPSMDERQIVLRALRDVNVPKFLKDDLKLFNGIVSDLFPRMVEEAVDHGDLEDSIRISLRQDILEDVQEYVVKVIQLYETTIVRHGLMLVGPTGSGKTKPRVAAHNVTRGLRVANQEKRNLKKLPD